MRSYDVPSSLDYDVLYIYMCVCVMYAEPSRNDFLPCILSLFLRKHVFGTLAHIHQECVCV